jgi:hypothetical protein
MLKLPVGVDQPDLPEAIGETAVTLPFSTRQAVCSDRLMITLVCAAAAQDVQITAGSAITNRISMFM